MKSRPHGRKRISVVIPVLNESRTIGSCLSLLETEIGRHQIVVVDGGSRDGTMGIVSRFRGVKQLSAPTGRGCQMNRGAAAAEGDILLFLHADTSLPPGGLKKIERAMEQNGVVAGAFSSTFDDPCPILKLYACFTRINHILFTYGDQGLFVANRVFKAIGGFREIPIMEDVEIQGRLRRAGPFVKIREPVTTSARRFRCHGVIKQQILNCALVCLYHAGVNPLRLARYYGSRNPK